MKQTDKCLCAWCGRETEAPEDVVDSGVPIICERPDCYPIWDDEGNTIDLSKKGTNNS